MALYAQQLTPSASTRHLVGRAGCATGGQFRLFHFVRYAVSNKNYRKLLNKKDRAKVRPTHCVSGKLSPRFRFEGPHERANTIEFAFPVCPILPAGSDRAGIQSGEMASTAGYGSSPLAAQHGTRE